MENPTLLDLFSGIGGFSLAFEREGFRTIGFSEIDTFACQVIKKHWPEIPNFGDITKWREWPDLSPYVITGGFPCQPFSSAGKRRGKGDNRYLWPAMLAVIARYRPAWVIGENVANIVDMELDNCMSDLEDIGYEVQSFVIPACAVGLEHRRNRVWIVAHLNKMGLKRQPPTDKTRFQSAYGGGIQPNRVAPPTRPPRRATGILESTNCGIIHGLPSKLDVSRIAALGNSIVPQIAQAIARGIMSVERDNY